MTGLKFDPVPRNAYIYFCILEMEIWEALYSNILSS